MKRKIFVILFIIGLRSYVETVSISAPMTVPTSVSFNAFTNAPVNASNDSIFDSDEYNDELDDIEPYLQLSAGEISEYNEFVVAMESLARILNGLAIDVQLRKKEIDVISLLLELSNVELSSNVLGKVIQLPDQLDISPIEQEINALKTAGVNWDDQKIISGLADLNTIVGKVKPNATAMDGNSVDEVMKAIEDWSKLNLTILETNPFKDLLDAIAAFEGVKPADAANNPVVFNNAIKGGKAVEEIEKVMKVIVDDLTALEQISTVLESNKDSLKSLFDVAKVLKSTDTSQYSSFMGGLNSFGQISEKLKSLSTLLSSSKEWINHVESFGKGLNPSKSLEFERKKTTLGFPKGLIDVDSIPFDLQSKNIKNLLSGGKKMDDLLKSMEWIQLLGTGMKKVIDGWMSGTNGQKWAKQSDILKNLIHLEQELNRFVPPDSLQNFVNFFTELQALVGKANQIVSFRSIYDTTVHDVTMGVGFVDGLSKRKDVAELQNLTALKEEFQTSSSTEKIHGNVVTFTGLSKLKAVLTSFNRQYIISRTFTFPKLSIDSLAIHQQAGNIKSLKDWMIIAKDVQAPSDLSNLLSEVRNLMTKIGSFPTVSAQELVQLAISTKTKVIDLQKSAATLKLTRRRRATTGSIRKWSKLVKMSSTVSKTSRAVTFLKPSGGLDASMSSALSSMVSNVPGLPQHSVLESEMKKAVEEIKKVREQVSSDFKKAQTFSHLSFIFEEMSMIKLLEWKRAVQLVKGLDETSFPPDQKSAVTAMKTSFQSTPVLEFVAYSQSIKEAPMDLETITVFFASIYGYSPSNNPSAASSSGESGSSESLSVGMIFVIIGSSVAGTALLVSAGFWLLVWYVNKDLGKKAAERKAAAKKNVTPKSEVDTTIISVHEVPLPFDTQGTSNTPDPNKSVTDSNVVANPEGGESKDVGNTGGKIEKEEGKDGGKKDGGNKDGGGKDGGNKDGEKKDGGGKDGGSKDGANKDGGNKDGEKKDGEKKEGEKKDGGNKDGEGKDGGNKDGGGKDGEKKDGEKKDGGGKDGGSKDGANKDGGNKDGEKKDGEKKEDEKKDGEKKEDEKKDGEKKDGEKKDGEKKDGEKKDGGSKDGGGKDGEEKDGGGKDGANKDGGNKDGGGKDGGGKDGGKKDGGGKDGGSKSGGNTGGGNKDAGSKDAGNKEGGAGSKDGGTKNSGDKGGGTKERGGQKDEAVKESKEEEDKNRKWEKPKSKSTSTVEDVPYDTSTPLIIPMDHRITSAEYDELFEYYQGHKVYKKDGPRPGLFGYDSTSVDQFRFYNGTTFSFASSKTLCHFYVTRSSDSMLQEVRDTANEWRTSSLGHGIELKVGGERKKETVTENPLHHLFPSGEKHPVLFPLIPEQPDEHKPHHVLNKVLQKMLLDVSSLTERPSSAGPPGAVPSSAVPSSEGPSTRRQPWAEIPGAGPCNGRFLPSAGPSPSPTSNSVPSNAEPSAGPLPSQPAADILKKTTEVTCH